MTFAITVVVGAIVAALVLFVDGAIAITLACVVCLSLLLSVVAVSCERSFHAFLHYQELPTCV